MKTSFFSNDYKNYILLFPVCILIGSVLINIAGIEKINAWKLFNNCVEMEQRYSFWYILKYVFAERVGHFIIIFLLCFSTIKDKLFLGLVGWLGIVFGVIQSALFVQYGLGGIVCFVVCICLHCAMYFLATIGLLIISEKGTEKLFSPGMFLVIIGYVLGAILEGIVSWWGLPAILNGLNSV